MAENAVGYRMEGTVATLRFDDGKANALSPAAIDELRAGLDRAENEAGAVMLAGRPGRFSAGFDLTTMKAGPDAARRMVSGGAELLLRLYESPLPIVTACSGHALAMGAVLLLGSDFRVGISGDFKIGLNEVSIRMTLPVFAVEIARDRLSKRHFQRSVIQAEIYTPEEAVDAGYLDRVVPAERLEEEAMAEAERLAALPRRAFSETKRRARGASVERIRRSLAKDMSTWGGRGA
jgi:enoyl-CoA hydratase